MAEATQEMVSMASEVTQAEGPRVTIKASCFSCRHCVSESYRVQSDSGINVYCAHPDFEQRKRVGDTVWDTPDWCPVQSLPELRHRLTAQSGEGRSGAGEDAEHLVRIFRGLPLHGDAGCDKLSDDEWRQVALAALNARQSGEGEREAKAIARFADAIGRLPFVSEALAKGYQFNAYESALNDDDAEDDEREYQIWIGPVSDLRFICAIEGMAKADLIEAALKIAALRATDDAGES